MGLLSWCSSYDIINNFIDWYGIGYERKAAIGPNASDITNRDMLAISRDNFV